MSETIHVDVEELREYLADERGTAVFLGFPAAIIDVAEIENASAQELLDMAEEQGIDLRKFSL